MQHDHLCKCCEQLFLDQATLELMTAEGYEWTRDLSALLSSANNGCSFCDLLSRNFDLAKLVDATEAAHSQQTDSFTGRSISLRLELFEGYVSTSEKRQFRLLNITAQDVDNERDLQHWGLARALSFTPKREMFRLMTLKDDAATDVIGSTIPSFTPSVGIRFNQAIVWMTECEKNHEVCKGLGDGPLPAKVLDLGIVHQANQIKLRDDLAGASGRYACLSYCWGSGQSTMTQSDTIDDFKNGIDITALPKTIQEAVYLTRKLGLRFLWVDALCILQDDDEDKARECSKMDHIYQRAYITIAAARAEDCHDGFLDGSESIADNVPRLPISCSDGRQGSVFVVLEHKDLFQDPLLMRAWAFQEHVLSSRILIWSKYQLIWLCTNGCEHEQDDLYGLAGPYYSSHRLNTGLFDRNRGFPKNDPCLARIHQALAGRAPITEGNFCFQFAPDFVHEEMQALWERIMEEYSKRKLSVVSDKLSALAGLASRFREFVQDDYLAGHWRRWLLPHLLWKCVNDGGAAKLPCCPSWSWLSVDGPICIENQDSSAIKDFQPQPVAKVIDCRIGLCFEAAPYDKVTFGELMIRGCLTSVALDFDAHKFCYDYAHEG